MEAVATITDPFDYACTAVAEGYRRVQCTLRHFVRRQRPLLACQFDQFQGLLRASKGLAQWAFSAKF